MRKLILALAASATLGAMSVAAQALPIVGSTSVAPATVANSAIQKTEVVVVKKRRPAAVVVHRRAPAVVVKRRAPAIVVH